MLYNVVLVSAEQQSGSATHIHISLLFQIFFPFTPPRNAEWSSLCSAVGSHSLSAPDVTPIALICQRQSLSPSSRPLLPPWCPFICSLCLYFCFANRLIGMTIISISGLICTSYSINFTCVFFLFKNNANYKCGSHYISSR